MHNKTTRRLDSLYRKAYIICKKRKIPFAHDCQEWSDNKIKKIGDSKIVKQIVDGCIYWRDAYAEDLDYPEYEGE